MRANTLTGIEQMEVIVEMTVKEILNNKVIEKDWMSFTDAKAYIGISTNTLAKYREMGLKVFEIEGVKRVSRKEIDRFLETHSN
jgi:hypothetical protein